MVCIWHTCINNFWGAFRLHKVVDRMFFWARRILKPQLSMYIDHRRHRHIQEGPNMIRSILTEEKHSNICQMLDNVQRRLSAFGIGKLKLERLLLEIIVRQELGSLSDSRPNIIPPSPITEEQSRSAAKAPTSLEDPARRTRKRSARKPPRHEISNGSPAQNRRRGVDSVPRSIADKSLNSDVFIDEDNSPRASIERPLFPRNATALRHSHSETTLTEGLRGNHEPLGGLEGNRRIIKFINLRSFSRI
jgi:hypothetical protein